MGNYKVVFRADDAGSSSAANQGVLNVIDSGLVKNVSLMAVGPKIEEAAMLLKERDDVCFGVHLVLNSEWDNVKWGPLTALDYDSGLVDEKGYFLPNTALFKTTKPQIGAIIAEYEAQYQKLIALGFNLTYADSHMMPEFQIPDLQAAVDQWAKEKGLLNHADYYSFPQNSQQYFQKELSIFRFLKQIPKGQYFYVIHPAVDSPELRQTGNLNQSGDEIAKERDKEARLFSSKLTTFVMKLLSIETIRYDQAQLMPRVDIKELLTKNEFV